jgi:uncharacterized membrane protein YfcA
VIDSSAITASAWLLLVVGALFVGFSKTAIGGMGMVSVAIYAAVLPARASTGLVLLLFIVGDLVAIRAYTQYTDWAVLRRLAPAVAVGIAVGSAFLLLAGDLAVRRTIGAILLVLVSVATLQRLRRATRDTELPEPPAALAVGTGAGSGFTSMVANAGGSIMSLYLLRLRLPVMVFLGTTAWFFFVINLVKVPISLGLGLVDGATVRLMVLLSAPVVVGAVVGRAVARRLSLATFEWVILGVTFVAAVNLMR